MVGVFSLYNFNVGVVFMKQYLRSLILNNLKNIPSFKKIKTEEKIHKNLFSSAYWKNSNVIGLTLSTYPEWDTYNIIYQAWFEDKQVVIPVTNKESLTMNFYLINSFDDVMEGNYKIKEPINKSKARYFSKDKIDLMIVPGIVFDKQGYRIGFGKGYFDRYLSDFNHSKISLLAEFQIINQIPTNEYDISVDCLITEKKNIKVK